MRDFVAQRHNVLLCSTIIETGIDVPTRQHHRHQPRRQVRPGAAAPAARPRRPLAPPGLRLPAGARRRGPDQAGGAAARGDPADGGARLGLLPRDARPRDPRRRRGARREPERQHAWRSASSSTTTCSAEAVRSLKAGQRARPAGAAVGRRPRSTCMRRRCCPTPTAATCTCACRSTSGWRRAEDAEQIDALLEEITDRFGKLPPQGQTLFDVHRLRVLARPYGVLKIDAAPKRDRRSPSGRTRRSTRCASSSWCRRTGTSSSPATTSCASSASSPEPRGARADGARRAARARRAEAAQPA